MKVHRQSKLMIEPPTHATGDIVFNLIIFFLVTISVQPDTGRTQEIPKSEPQKEQKDQTKPIEVVLASQAVILNGDPMSLDMFEPALKKLIDQRYSQQADESDDYRIVTVLTKDKSTQYHQWISVTTKIHDAGGVVTLQLEEEREVNVE